MKICGALGSACDYTLHFMKNVGHFSPLEAPDVWAEHILQRVREP